MIVLIPYISIGVGTIGLGGHISVVVVGECPGRDGGTVVDLVLGDLVEVVVGPGLLDERAVRLGDLFGHVAGVVEGEGADLAVQVSAEAEFDGAEGRGVGTVAGEVGLVATVARGRRAVDGLAGRSCELGTGGTVGTDEVPWSFFVGGEGHLEFDVGAGGEGFLPREVAPGHGAAGIVDGGDVRACIGSCVSAIVEDEVAERT